MGRRTGMEKTDDYEGCQIEAKRRNKTQWTPAKCEGTTYFQIVILLSRNGNHWSIPGKAFRAAVGRRLLIC